MKTTSFRFILAALAATAALVGCTKEITPNFENDKVNPEGSRIIAVSFAPQTKTTLDGLQPKFEDGKDTVLISNTNALDTCVVSVKDNKATISTNLTGPLTAVYPYKAAKMSEGNENEIDTVLVSTVQSGKFADANICMARMNGENDESLSFENKTAVFKITPGAGESTQHVEVSADGFEIANDVPTGSTHTSLETIHVNTTTADSVYVSILVPEGLTVGSLSFSDGTNVKTIKDERASTAIAAGTLYTVTNANWESTEADIPDGALKGVFSVSTTKKVHFSQGNLTYDVNASTNKWKFYENQYYCAENSSASETLISLFTWGYGDWSKEPTTTTYLTSHTSNDESFESFDSSEDWGTAIDNKGTWRTLTKDEWCYLFAYDPEKSDFITTSPRYPLFKTGVTVCGKANCVVLLPDGWKWEGDVGTEWQTEYPETQTNNEVTWQTMEDAGAVCLPAAGVRDGSIVNLLGEVGCYWSSSAYNESGACYVVINSGNVAPFCGNTRGSGFSVRLVTDVSAAPFFGIEWEDIVSGTYVSAATHAVILDNLPGKEIPTVLQQRKDQPSTYRLRNVFGDGMHLIINAIDQFGEDDGGKYQFLRIPVQNTGLIHASYGAISVRDIGYWQGDDSYITESGYESGMYEDHSCFFKMQWFVSAGSIGYNWYDYFVPDEE